ncbi:MAG TPA: LytTR family DNA-binding domain-containing protein [Ferruginibacter sp.]|nr:LytTR family DNA-binding domain-containing protein [Ferruginibacter sp.]HRE64325.1 LytTR family DNA-binding domain-containing protein [Ferruginibacter sp.]
MSTINVMIVDDEPRGVSSLQKLLQMNCKEVQVLATANNVDDAKDKIIRLQPQLVFLDIAMPQKNGFDLLIELPEINFETIFVTAHDSFLLQAFHFSAVDYLLKPVDDELLKNAVTRVVKRLGNQSVVPLNTLLQNLAPGNEALHKRKLCIPSLKGFQVVSIKDIVYCEAANNYTNFHFANRHLICASKPIHEYDSLLCDSNFVRIHKSYLVNMEHITEFVKGEGGSVVLSNGHIAEVSRRKKDDLMHKMKAYFRF